MIAGSGQLAVYLAFLIFLLGFVMILYLYIRTGRFGATHLDEANEPPAANTGTPDQPRQD